MIIWPPDRRARSASRNAFPKTHSGALTTRKAGVQVCRLRGRTQRRDLPQAGAAMKAVGIAALFAIYAAARG
jgi:hypothetical protein